MANKKETKIGNIEREYVIPLREKCRSVPRYKKANKAVKTIKEFIAKHMQIRDRDLDKIKVDRYLNEAVWLRGIRKPPAKIKVKAIREGEIVRVELVELMDKFKFRKLREEARDKKASDVAEGKKKTIDKMKDAVTKKDTSKTDEDKKDALKSADEKEKKATVIEAGAKMEKDLAKKAKHQSGGKTKEPKHPIRVALEK